MDHLALKLSQLSISPSSPNFSGYFEPNFKPRFVLAFGHIEIEDQGTGKIIL